MNTNDTINRKELIAAAHHLKPLVLVGRGGITDGIIGAVDKALTDHELIKIKFNDFKEERKTLAESVAHRTSSILLRLIGNTAILYRKGED